LSVKIRSLLFCLILLGAFQAQSWAFFPSTQDIIDKLHERLGGLDTFEAEITFEKNPYLTLSIWYKAQKWRQEWVLEKGGNATLMSAAVGRGESFHAVFPERSEYPLPILHFWFSPDTSDWLQSQWVSPDVKSYQFFELKPCLVLGADHNEMYRPQVWIHNEEFVPVRMISWDGLHWQWLDYYDIGNYPLPHRCRLIFPTTTTLEMHISWKRINGEIPDTLFSEQAFREKFASSGEPPADSEFFNFLLRRLPRAWQ